MVGDPFDVRRILRAVRTIEVMELSEQDPSGLSRLAGRAVAGLRPPAWIPGERGCEQLVASMTSPMALVGDRCRPAAWRAVLTSPSLALHMPGPSEATCLDFGVAAQREMHYAHLGLAAVICEEDMSPSDPADVAAAPIAAVGELLLTGRGRTARAHDVTARFRWFDNTDDFAVALARLWVLAGRPKSAERLKRVILLRSAALAAIEPSSPEFTAVARVFGIQLEVLSPTNEAGVLHRLRSSPPAALVVESSAKFAAESMIEVFRSCAAQADLIEIPSDPCGYERAVYQAFKRIARIGQGLVSLRIPAVQIRKKTRISKVPGKTWMHRAHGRFTLFDDGTYISVDRAGHGGSVYKQFTESADGLVWAADLDDARQPIIGKHKGPIGLFVPWSDLKPE